MRHCVIALTLLLGAHTAVSDDNPVTDTRKPLTFNISPGGYPPFTIAHPDGSVSGIFWDTLQVITNRLELRLEPIEIPPKRSDSLLDQGYSDVTMRAIEWTANPEEFLFTDPVMMTRDAIFVHRDSQETIEQVSDLNGMLLSRLGFRYPWLDDRLAEGSVTLIPVQQQGPMFKRLYHGGGRFTGAISNVHVGYWMLRRNRLWNDHIHEAPIRLDEVALRLMLPPRHAELVPLINAELNRMRESGELEAIIETYQ